MPQVVDVRARVKRNHLRAEAAPFIPAPLPVALSGFSQAVSHRRRDQADRVCVSVGERASEPVVCCVYCGEPSCAPLPQSKTFVFLIPPFISSALLSSPSLSTHS